MAETTRNAIHLLRFFSRKKYPSSIQSNYYLLFDSSETTYSEEFCKIPRNISVRKQFLAKITALQNSFKQKTPLYFSKKFCEIC